MPANEKILGSTEVVQLMNIQNELNLEINGENLKIENHIEADERKQKEEVELKMEDYTKSLNIGESDHPNIYNPAPVNTNSLLNSEALANKQR